MNVHSYSLTLIAVGGIACCWTIVFYTWLSRRRLRREALEAYIRATHVESRIVQSPPTPPVNGYRKHSTCQGEPEMVITADEMVVARICACGAQLPPQIFRDPDGWIVDTSWEWIPVSKLECR